jgi:acyl-CoA synthetase (AMP-forming)/AMP-acid ligase II
MTQLDLVSMIDGLSGGSEHTGIHFYPDRTDQPVLYSYPALHAMAVNAAQRYRESGLGPGARILLPFETSMECVVAFLAITHAGGLVLCVKPPAPGAASGPYVDFIERIAAAHDAKMILGVPSVQNLQLSPALLPLPALDPSPAAPRRERNPGPDAVAFVQFSSGSTSFPKGVPITHRNLIRQLQLLAEFDRRQKGEPGANWLPLFHDMGLIGGLLSALYAELDLHLCSPRRFLAEPLQWLELVSRRRIRRFAIPNFGIEYLLRAIRSADDATMADWRFDELTHVFVGAEPINPRSFAAFVDCLTRRGMRPEAIQPAYGMAEAVLIAAGGRDIPPRVAKTANGSQCISVGKLLPGFEVAIETDSGQFASAGEHGEVLLRGGSLAAEYFESAAPLLDGRGYYRTDDIGFIEDGELFILGRKGDRLKLNGETYFAHDFEQIVQQVPGIRARGCVVLQHGGQVHVLIEQAKPSGYELLRLAVAEAVQSATGIKILAPNIHVIQPGQILRTSSGKLQRLEMLDRLSNGRLRTWSDANTAVAELNHR